MSLKKCEKCGEAVDVAKAFCPECGYPFVEEEKREGSSEFDKYAGTVNMSDSVYKVMLSEMDLDTSRPPEDEKSNPAPVKKILKSLPAENKPPDQNKNSVSSKWIIIAGGGAVVFIFIAAVIFIASYIYFY